MKAAAASGARPGQGALRRRPRRAAWSPRRYRRRAMPPSWSRSTTRCCRRARRPRTPAIRARRWSTTTSPRNTVYDWALGDKAAVDAAFASAAHVTKLELVNNRLIPNAIEPRAAIGEYDRGAEAYTLYITSQNPHVERLLMSAFVRRARAQGARDRARRRRRLRLEDLPLRRGVRLPVASKRRPAGEVDRRAQRELPVRRARPRPRHPRRAGAGRGRQVPRAAR